MKSILNTKTVVVLGVSLCGVTGYLLYLLFKNDDDEDYSSTIPKSSYYKVRKFRVPKNMVRVIVGRKGKNLKKFEEQSGTYINFLEETDSESLCEIKGSVKGCNMAENLILELIENQPVLECFDVIVPQLVVGKIIGKCGDHINEISSITGAKLNVSRFSRDDTRCVTIKGTRDQINLARSFIEEIVENSQASQSQIEAMLAKREPRIPAKLNKIDDDGLNIPEVEKLCPASGNTHSLFEVYVSALVDPSHLWLQIVGPKATQLDLLVEEMTEYYSKEENREAHVLSIIQVGDLVASKFKYDQKWYRAEVLKYYQDVENPQVELYYVDYGDTDTVQVKEVFELRTDFLKLHFQAIECYLARIEPVGDRWTEDAVDRFEEWTHVAQWTKLTARLNGCTLREKTRAKREGSPVPGVDLFDVRDDQDVDLADQLVKRGYAAYKKGIRKDHKNDSTAEFTQHN